MMQKAVVALCAALLFVGCSAESPRDQAGRAPAAAQPVDERADAEPVEAPGLDVGAADAGESHAPDAPLAAPTGPGPAESRGGATGGTAAAASGTPGAPTPARTAEQGVQAPTPGPAADEGADVLRRASAAYENVRSLRAEFVMNFENPLLRQSTTSRGTIYQQQPDRIALRFSDPDGDVILGDGQYFWVYYPSVNAQQVIRSPAAAGGEAGVNLQAQFVGNPVERFRYELHGTESVGGRAAHVLTLVPRQRAEYRSLKVWIDGRDGLARRFEITEHNGSVRRFDLQNLQVNPAIQESVFRFTPPAGARVIDAG